MGLELTLEQQYSNMKNSWEWVTFIILVKGNYMPVYSEARLDVCK